MLYEIDDEMKKIIEGLNDMALKVGGRQNLDAVNKVEEILKNPVKEVKLSQSSLD